MAKFTVTAVNDAGESKVFYYDNNNSALTDENGEDLFISPAQKIHYAHQKYPVGKGFKYNFTTIKISMGLSCNYSCEYCSQRFVPHAEETNPSDVELFIKKLPNWYRGGVDGRGNGTRFEFWGGEPFVYWKTMKPLAERIRVLYPNASFSLITNGSLLDDEKLDWLDEMDFSFAISHDGPGQHVRGPDPFATEEGLAIFKKAMRRFGPKGLIGVNTMMNRTNNSRAAAQKYFEELLGEDAKYLTFGEGGFVDAYDEGGLTNSLSGLAEEVEYRKVAYADIESGGASRFGVVRQKMEGFGQMIADRAPKEVLGQKCGMDKVEQIAVDLNGNVITCQNVSTAGTNPAGASHKIGHVDKIEDVKLTTITHWSDRDECSNCPVLQLCQGSCMFLSGELWDASCNNSFSDNVVFFAATIKSITGYKPVHIEGPQRPDRKYIWEARDEQKRKFIPIKATA
jgi:uncharacterized protein